MLKCMKIKAISGHRDACIFLESIIGGENV
jgi:hypothetical protein